MRDSIGWMGLDRLELGVNAGCAGLSGWKGFSLVISSASLRSKITVNYRTCVRVLTFTYQVLPSIKASSPHPLSAIPSFSVFSARSTSC